MADRAPETKRSRPQFHARVARKEWLTPRMARVVFGDLDGYVHIPYTDRYAKLHFPADSEGDKERIRAYTIRSYDAAAGELAIDIYYHGDDGLGSPWVREVLPGTPVRFTGPGGAYAPDPDAFWHLLVGDESALPAIASALEAVPAGVQAVVLLEVEDGDEEQPLPTQAKAEVSWFHRATAPNPPGIDLIRAVEALDFGPDDPQVFVHGEAELFRSLRRHLTRDRGLPLSQLSISGYWRRGRTDEVWRSEKKSLTD